MTINYLHYIWSLNLDGIVSPGLSTQHGLGQEIIIWLNLKSDVCV